MATSTQYIKAKNEVLATYDSSGGDSTFQPVITLTQPARLIKFKSDSSVDITLSYDGTNDHDIILSGDREIEDLCANKTLSEGMFRKAGTTISAKSVSGTGNFYIVAIYTDLT